MNALPNVIVVLTDQQRWDTTGVHGNPAGATPEFDSMAQGGTHFARAFTPQPVCGPARASLQTGKWATQAGVFRNGLPLSGGETTLASVFGDAGYRTAYIGKWHLGGSDAAAAGPVPVQYRGGYQHWLASDLLEFTSDAYRTVLWDESGRPVRLVGYRSDAVLDEAIRFVADHHDRPFLLFVSLLEPHHQNETDDYPAPSGYRERFEGRWMPADLAALGPLAAGGGPHRHLGGYLGQIKRVDEGVGRLRDALRSLELTERTVLVWTADHGSHFRTRNDEYKRSAHDASIRVPWAATGYGFTGGGRVGRPVSTVDLAPTLIDAAGLPVPAAMTGRSLMPLVRGGAGEARPEGVYVQISESHVGRAVRTGRWLYAVTAVDADPWNEATSDRYRETELYDVDTDPHQLENLAGLSGHRPVANRLRERLLELMADAGEGRPAIEEAPSRVLDGRRPDTRVGELPWQELPFAHARNGGAPGRARDRGGS
ncbi:sulfatase-like hydrolase/transferase [Streptomyces subrutilus]|uniref:sulfatase-like hydrolase/transferase n=1 Tax=Streptomyces subrutilus TaxID=36818 RepID=UPI0033C8B828